jgi:hypothetical protein
MSVPRLAARRLGRVVAVAEAPHVGALKGEIGTLASRDHVGHVERGRAAARLRAHGLFR